MSLPAWRRAIPPRWGWVRIAAAPSSYLLACGLLAAAVAKAGALRALGGETAWPLVWPWAIATDGVLHAALLALFALGEARARWIAAVTVPLAALVAALAGINAGYLSVAGEQLSWEAVAYGGDSLGALAGIVVEGLGRHAAAAVVAAGVVVAIPVAARRLVRARAGERGAGAGGDEARVDGRQRAHCAAAVGAIALATWASAPAPEAFAARQLGRNATWQTYWGWVAGDEPGRDRPAAAEFVGYDPPALVEPEAIEALAARAPGSRPNVVVVILESTRYDHTSLSDGGGQGARAGWTSPARTPALAALARRGVSARRARAVLPHTTKSVFSLLCGRLPLMQREPVEVSAHLQVQCVPAILGAAGYDTAFFQSALGTFEHRPRLVARLGFARFEAWEDIGGQPLGYLASDDESLAPAFARWLDGAREPFFAAVLTSATHHPYRLSDEAARRAAAEGLPATTDAERYARLVEASDRMLAGVLAAVDARGARDRTLVVVVGDHGEGFGARGVRQHDNNFFEEGLRVPLVFAGPGVREALPAAPAVPRVPSEIDRDVSLADVAPSILDLLEVPLSAAASARIEGRSVFAQGAGRDGAGEPRWFGCYYASRCRGFVLGDRKVVVIPQSGQAFYFDLARDPDEQTALPLTGDLRARIPALHAAVDAHHARRFPLALGDLGALPGYGQWRCPAGQGCRHPRSPPGVFFEPP